MIVYLDTYFPEWGETTAKIVQKFKSRGAMRNTKAICFLYVMGIKGEWLEQKAVGSIPVAVYFFKEKREIKIE